MPGLLRVFLKIEDFSIFSMGVVDLDMLFGSENTIQIL